MDKFADRISEWLPLGIGDTRRNFISGLIFIIITWTLLNISPGDQRSNQIESIKIIIYLIDSHAILIFLLIFLTIFIGKIIDFVGGVFPIIYNYLSEWNFKKVSSDKIFWISILRCFKRRKTLQVKKKWKNAYQVANKINQISKLRYSQEKQNRFKSDLTSNARYHFDNMPEIVKDGLLNPFGWNFDISINFLVSQSDDKKIYWLVSKENRRKFIYNSLCSIFLPIFLLLLILSMQGYIYFMVNLPNISEYLYDIFNNGLPEQFGENKKNNVSVNMSDLDPAPILASGIILFIVFFIFYVKYVKSSCIQYAEFFALGHHAQLDESEEPIEASV